MRQDGGEDVLLVRTETSPDDVHGMMASKGILTTRGGLVSHAAVVARGWGTPAIVGAESIKIDAGKFSVGDTVVKEGDWLSLDGTTVYVANFGGNILAVNAQTGSTLWSKDVDMDLAGGPGAGYGLVIAGSTEGDIIWKTS